MKTEILSMLRETDGYISGQQICEQFQVSRTAVWKVMEQLKAEGYQIEAVRNRGYHLEKSPDVLGEAEIKSLLNTSWAGCDVLYFPETDSTNTRAKRLGDEGAVHGTLVAADRQTGGKGRRGRRWESPAGSSIYMSILLRPDIPPDQAPMLTLVMAQSTAEAIRIRTGEEALIKWPNDIVINGKKVCGILTEMSTEIQWINHVVIGVGINVNTEYFPEELTETATSIYLESGGKQQRSGLIAEVLKQFERYYAMFLETGNLSAMQEEYNRLLVNRDREVKVLEPGNEYNGYAIGINETGELLIRTEDGQIREVYAGEVSVRGIYGYV
ncbi:MAG: biotin--[acetyl-CoA-carboxylase] ligase [Dorea sp.]|nr:biotin--[acetyl-CoA-carboxylase] ligase [Dorea sp.]